MAERDWKKRMRRRILIRLTIVLVLLALFGAAFWAFVMPYIDAESHMSRNEGMVLQHLEDDRIELTWPAAPAADYYRVEVFRTVEVENKKGQMEEQLQCLRQIDVLDGERTILEELPLDEELTVRVNTMVKFSVPGQERVRLGDSPLEIVLRLAPPQVSWQGWQAHPDTDSVELMIVKEPGDIARLWYLDGENQWQLLKTLTEDKTTVTFGEGMDLPMLEHGETCLFKLDACREGNGSTYYSLESESISFIREDFLDRDLQLELQDAGHNVCTLTWNETKGEYYELQIRDNPGAEWVTICTVEQTGERSFTTEHLKAFRDYSFRVVAQGGQAPEGAFAAESETREFRTAEAVLYSTIWPIKEIPVYADPERTQALGKVAGGTTLCVAEVTETSFGIRWGDGIGYIDSNYVMIDLAEYLGELCAYNITNSYSSVFKFNKYEFPDITDETLAGYEKIRLADGTYLAPLLYPVAQRLLTAAKNAYDAGYRLKIYDAYRPNRTTVLLYNEAEKLLDEPVPGKVRDPNGDDPDDLLTYGEFLTDNGKYPLNYFLAQGGSLHNLGIAVDLTIESRVDRVEQPMQSAMHDLTHFSVIYRNNQNAVLLKGFMESAGFGGLVSEWWHFQDNDIRKTVSLGALWNGVSPEGWKLSDGGWRYRLADGTYACGRTLTIGGTEYTFDEWGYVN